MITSNKVLLIINIQQEKRIVKGGMAMMKKLEIRDRDKGKEITFGSKKFIFTSGKIIEILKVAERIASHDINIIITGETGVGKDVLAEIIHLMSSRVGEFINCNIAGLSDGLIESELFGYVKGSFTGARQNRKGYFRAADKGTLLLNEIGDIDFNSQVKILMAIENKEVCPVGSYAPVGFDARVISITNQPLKQLIREKKIRQDLFYRLNGFRLHVPPLRKRKDDILILADYFVKESCELFNKENVVFSEDAKSYILRYGWPGNIRELKSTVEQAVVINQNGVLKEKDLGQFNDENDFDIGDDLFVDETTDDLMLVLDDPTFSLLEFLKNKRAETEKKVIILALQKCDSNATKAAKILKLDRGHLYRKIRQYGID